MMIDGPRTEWMPGIAQRPPNLRKPASEDVTRRWARYNVFIMNSYWLRAALPILIDTRSLATETEINFTVCGQAAPVARHNM